MVITNKQNLPEGFVKACGHGESHNKKGCLSATTLLKGVKEIIISERHWDELEQDCADMLWAVFGTAVHSMLEQEGETDFTEELLTWTVSETLVTGRIDNYDMKRQMVTDYKTCSVWKWKFADFSDWRKQGLIYAWLLRKNGLECYKCRFIAMMKDHSKTEAKRDKEYPQFPIAIYEFEVTDDDIAEIDEFINRKVSEYEVYKKVDNCQIPECTEKERWYSGDKFAVTKDGNKKAFRVFDTEELAIQCKNSLEGKYHIEYRKGESKKCQEYCLCCDYCDYYKTLDIK